jgi:hypothetical protein
MKGIMREADAFLKCFWIPLPDFDMSRTKNVWLLPEIYKYDEIFSTFREMLVNKHTL